MDTLTTKDLKTIIENSLTQSMSYEGYRELVRQLTESKSTTGELKTEALVDYTVLNNKRMKRWDKTVKVSDTAINKIAEITKKTTWLVLTESWCGDAAHLMPVMNKLAELNDNIDFKVVLRDENEALMNQFLTNGGKSIPKLIMIDDDSKTVINTFGPRPSEATHLVNDYKAKHGKLTPEFKEELQHWYNKNKGQAAIKDLIELSIEKQ